MFFFWYTHHGLTRVLPMWRVVAQHTETFKGIVFEHKLLAHPPVLFSPIGWPAIDVHVDGWFEWGQVTFGPSCYLIVIICYYPLATFLLVLLEKDWLGLFFICLSVGKYPAVIYSVLTKGLLTSYKVHCTDSYVMKSYTHLNLQLCFVVREGGGDLEAG